MYNPHFSPNFQSNGINSLLVDDWIFMANFLMFSTWDIHNSSQCGKHLPYTSFELWGVSLWRPISLSESTLGEGQCSPAIHNTMYLVCMAHNHDLTKYPVQFRFFTWRFKLLSVWDWKQTYVMDFTSKRTIHTSFSISSFLTVGCRTPAFLSQP